MAALVCLAALVVDLWMRCAAKTTSFMHLMPSDGRARTPSVLRAAQRARRLPAALVSREGAQADDRGGFPLTITADDLIPVNQLIDPSALRETNRLVVLSGDGQRREPAKYIGQNVIGVTATPASITALLKARDSGPFRVGPTVVTRFSRGGKTRMLKEIAKQLRAAKIPVLPITFNDETSLDPKESSSRTLIESILLRIGWSAAKNETIEAVGKELGKEVVNFGVWVGAVSVTEEVILQWLGDRPCVLMIDELNQLLKKKTPYVEGSPEAIVAAYLKTNWLGQPDRFLVFSSHVLTTSTNLQGFWVAGLGDRPMQQLRMPLIENVAEAREVISDAADEGQMCWVGRAPGLLMDLYHRDPRNADPANVLRKAKMMPSGADAPSAVGVIKMALDGNTMWAQTIPDWQRWMDIYGDNCVWPPCYLGAACTKVANSPAVEEKFGGAFCSGLRAIENFLDNLHTQPRESGKRWEGVAAAGVLLRLLESHISYTTQGKYPIGLTPEAQALLPPDVVRGCSFGDYVLAVSHPDREIRTLRQLIDYFNDSNSPIRRVDKGVAAFFVLPTHLQFEGHDFYIFITVDGQLTEVRGYQCKQGFAKKPTPASLEKIARAFRDAFGPGGGKPGGGKEPALDGLRTTPLCRTVWFTGDSGGGEDERNRKDEYDLTDSEGVPVRWPSQATMSCLVGFSLALTCPFEWLA
ncbi:unnamed protein product [Vitrella brassicaformis CCMP3155]|uniref:ATPase AAA-type core domain-containing protein n=3 Tax=Vitrella brassicaformis TaxID=1169539 RepID=A0A0G4E931_VITBC|nr:unnamed protein product [Vitrella brassicaformis CCMP3155]|eukprot:CEL92040.1 unnamed protein product [Vitrella brassicaformis CCMP3155]